MVDNMPKCKECGCTTMNKNGYCGNCTTNHGEVWVLNFKNWRWVKQERGEIKWE